MISHSLYHHALRYNDAEYITDLVTEADRMGKGSLFSEAYAG